MTMHGSIVQGAVHVIDWLHKYILHWWSTRYILFTVLTLQLTWKSKHLISGLWLRRQDKCYKKKVYPIVYQFRFGLSQIAHLGWATSGPPAAVAANVGPPVAHPPHRWLAIWDVVFTIQVCLSSFLDILCVFFYQTRHSKCYDTKDSS